MGIIYIMPQRYKKPCESFGFLEKLYVLYYIKKGNYIHCDTKLFLINQ